MPKKNVQSLPASSKIISNIFSSLNFLENTYYLCYFYHKKKCQVSGVKGVPKN
ncbi:Uncharacterized protein dnm_092190 [Desulfonema magnum]|uniref:Uncharacterized protein n=1 Tax=Desulfonema magnum TaxID=45655 RepID=A0A975BX25_9BACT|nr:Uncharacterized protein dnm_092190 [Desulfonema magnum]